MSWREPLVYWRVSMQKPRLTKEEIKEARKMAIMKLSDLFIKEVQDTIDKRGLLDFAKVTVEDAIAHRIHRRYGFNWRSVNDQ
jgi:hypothetical protein